MNLLEAPARESLLGPRLPLKLGRFTLCEELGAGGMATVYLARMELAGGIERLVALKTIHPHLAREANFVDMFLDEARIASHVSHPNVCSTYDFGEVDGVYYLAMEYLLGEPLFDVINRLVERFDDSREVVPFLAARIIADAAEGLHAAHVARGPNGEVLHIVHRDVSPQNLFVTYEGSVKVVDFGCAKAAERIAHTSTGILKGKVGYAAPEQLKSDHVDRRADVFALGVVLWEALTLSPLFSRNTAMKTAMAVLEDEIEPASHGRSWVPEAVAEIAQKALSRDPEGRYPTARAFGRDLRRFIADSGFTLESAELAEWMGFLFDTRQDQRVSQAQRVRDMDISHADAISLQDLDAEDVELLEPEPMPAPYVAAVADLEPAPDAPPERVAGMRRRWPWVLALLALLIGGAAILHRYYEPAPWLYEMVGMEAPAARASPAPLGAPDPGPATAPIEEPIAEGVDPGEAPTPDAPEADAPEAPATETPTADAPEAAAPEDATPAGRRSRRGGGASTVTTVVSGGGWSPSPAPNAPSPSPSAAPSPEPDPGPAPGTGRIILRASSGWAEVYDGGRRLGRTPFHADLPPGTHRLRVLPYGQEPAEPLEVRVSSGVDQSFTLQIAAP